MYATQVTSTEARSAPANIPRGASVDFSMMLPSGGRPATLAADWSSRSVTGHSTQVTATSRLAACMDFMLAHLHQPLRISTLSTMAGLSASRFFELFKHATGDTPLNWFIRARMKWAGELLVQSNLPIKQIAGQVGYEDQFYFSRLFKAVQGVPPSAYRLRKKSPAEGGCAGALSDNTNSRLGR